MNTIFAFFNLGPMEIVVIVIIGVLLFGKRLPDIGRSVGKSIVEFKKGVKGLEDEMDTVNAGVQSAGNVNPMPQENIRPPQRVAPTAPKFEDTAVKD